MPESDNPTVGSWQETLKGIAGDFGRVAAENLRKQSDKDAENARVETPSEKMSNGIMKLIVIVVVIVLAVVFLGRKFLK